MFEWPGEGLGVDGLGKVLLIFDAGGRLAALQMTMGAGGMGKPAYNRVLGHLGKRYKLETEQSPFVGDQLAVLRAKGSRIEVEAPHMSFDMMVTYMTDAFHQTFQRAMAADKEGKARRESTRF